MNAERLNAFSDWAAMVVKRNCGSKYHPCLIYSGMSGTSLATGVSCALSRNYNIIPSMIYVRKSGEKSHGCNEETLFPYISSSAYKKKRNVYFIDDFIDSGKSFKRCMKSLKKFTDYDNHSFNKTKIIVTRDAFNCAELAKEYSVFEYTARKNNRYKLAKTDYGS
jgi:orotate phosphoribosyltransferase